MKFSACIEWLFADETENFADRIRLASRAGLDAVEFWRWTDKDIGSIEAALAETGLPLSGFVAEPMIALTDPANHGRFLDGLGQSADMARRLGAKILIAQAGADLPEMSRGRQRAALVECLARSADVLAGTGIRLGVEPLNTLIDHQGYFLPSTREALDIVDEVGRDEIGIVYDLYHSGVMGEPLVDVLTGRVDRVCHVHVADHPGRNEPGSGNLELAEGLSWLQAQGYSGAVGLEYRPREATSSGLEAVLKSLQPGRAQAPA